MKSNWTWIFMFVGIITVISGIFLLINEDYLIGFSGTCVGALLIYQNWIILKAAKKENQ
ncbi:MAG: hypothetical protein AAGK97_17775 [Bacteroidota bacterium]